MKWFPLLCKRSSYRDSCIGSCIVWWVSKEELAQQILKMLMLVPTLAPTEQERNFMEQNMLSRCYAIPGFFLCCRDADCPAAAWLVEMGNNGDINSPLTPTADPCVGHSCSSTKLAVPRERWKFLMWINTWWRGMTETDSSQWYQMKGQSQLKWNEIEKSPLKCKIELFYCGAGWAEEQYFHSLERLI